MKRPFAPLGCSVMAHVKPKNRRTWGVHDEVGYSIGTSMEHHRCFNVYIVKTRATRIRNSVFFKHQYITNPQIMPETLVMKAAAELTSALKGSTQDVETADALAKVSNLFQKIFSVKSGKSKSKRATEPAPYCYRRYVVLSKLSTHSSPSFISHATMRSMGH